MAAPVPLARSTPGGIKLKDGFRTLITFTANPAIKFFEKGVQPPGVDGGDPVEQTTMHNVTWRTMAPRTLMTLTASSCKAAYDPLLYTEILVLINRETTITITFPDGTTLAFFGYLKSFEPAELVEGTQPECTINLVPTNFDPTNHVEAAPVLTNVVGT